MWEHVAPLVRSCADGFNACIFAYGQTGSGKPPQEEASCTSGNVLIQAAVLSVQKCFPGDTHHRW